MGLDGFSMGNLGLNADMTSAQMVNQAEQIKKESEIKIKDVTETAEDSGVKRKEDDDESNNEDFSGSFKEKEGNSDESENENDNLLNEKDFENTNPKEFSIRINSETELIELLRNEDKKVLETIKAEDLMKLISKLDNASGILVNRKI